MFTYNTTPHTATGFTPFELTYGHQAILPITLTKQLKSTYSYDDYTQELRERMCATNQLAKDYLKQEKLRQSYSTTKASIEKHLKQKTKSYFMTKPSEEDDLKN